ncbi:MAG: hypothetical protein ABSE62_10620 [Chthoniobacteraceae bacterium]|jgi:hypothetical protein
MKQSLLVLFLLAAAAPLFANDEGGDGAYIPDYRELVREGYVIRPIEPAIIAAPKPTQAYYGNGYIIYYGYQAVPVHTFNANFLYAFGHPTQYFSHLNPIAGDSANLNDYAVANGNPFSAYGPGNFIAQARQRQVRAGAISVVQKTTTKATSNGSPQLPAIGEKPAQ